MPKIDYTKPIQYRDGKPAKFLRWNDKGNAVITPKDNIEADAGNYYNSEGVHTSGFFDPIMNVPEKKETTMVDWTKPLELTDGRSVKVISTRANGQRVVNISSSDAQDDIGRVYKENGKHIYQELPDVRNVATPAAETDTQIAAEMRTAVFKIAELTRKLRNLGYTVKHSTSSNGGTLFIPSMYKDVPVTKTERKSI